MIDGFDIFRVGVAVGLWLLIVAIVGFIYIGLAELWYWLT